MTLPYALQPLGGWRNEACLIPIAVPGVDLAGKAIRAQIRGQGDNPVLLLDMPAVTDAALTGIRILPTTYDGAGIPTGHAVWQITKAGMQGLPYAGEVGDAWLGAYAMQIDGVTRLTGAFGAFASPIDSDAAPANRPVGWGGAAGGALVPGVTLIIGDGGVTVSVAGADLIGPLVAAASAQADRAAASAVVATAKAQAAQASFLATEALFESASKTTTARVGTAGDPVAGDPYVAVTIQSFTPIPLTGKVKEIGWRTGGNGGTLSIYRNNKVGTVYTPAGAPLTLTLAPNTLNAFKSDDFGDFSVEAGQFFGFLAPTDGMALTVAEDPSLPGLTYVTGNTSAFPLDAGPYPATYHRALQFYMVIEDVTFDFGASNAGSASLQSTIDTLVGAVAPDEVQIAYGGWTGRIITGESTSNGYNSSPAISKVQPYSNITFSGGVKANPLTGIEPLVEDDQLNGETTVSSALNHASRLAAIGRGIKPADFVQFGFVCGRDGAKVSDISKPGDVYNRFLQKTTAAKALADAAGKAFVVPTVTLIIGINDNDAGTPLATLVTQLNQLDSDMTADILATTQQTSPVHWMVVQSSNGVTAAGKGGNAILAMPAFCRADPRRRHMVCPSYILPRVDGTHFSAATTALLGHYIGRAEDAIADGQPSPAVLPLSATVDGTTLRIRFQVPIAPLVIAPLNIGAGGPQPIVDQGLKVVDDTGTLALSNIAVGTDGVSITATLDRAVTTNAK